MAIAPSSARGSRSSWCAAAALALLLTSSSASPAFRGAGSRLSSGSLAALGPAPANLLLTIAVAVNHSSWSPPSPCYDQGISSDPIPAGQPLAQGEVVEVGQCDSGPLVWDYTAPGAPLQGFLITFKSGVIEDASPPQCVVPLRKDAPNGLGLAPPTVFGTSASLPYCATMDSREGYHLTEYTFTVVAWKVAPPLSLLASAGEGLVVEGGAATGATGL